MNGARLLLVGRDDGVSRGWLEPLRCAGVNIALVCDGADALRHLELIEPDLILVDLQLAGPVDGLDTCRAIRARSAAILAIASATDCATDELLALAVGADQYLPAATPGELVVARLRALVRRARGTVVVDRVVSAQAATGAGAVRVLAPRAARAAGVAASIAPTAHRVPAGRMGTQQLLDGPVSRGRYEAGALAAGPHSNGAAAHAMVADAPYGPSGPDGPTERIVDGELEIDLVAREVRVDGVPVALTRIEFDLLVALARHPRRVLTREQLMTSAWEEPFDGSHVLDAHLSRMRCKLLDAGGGRVAHAVRGVGYRLRS
jgi:DNA-binding response OmpR family regulator